MQTTQLLLIVALCYLATAFSQNVQGCYRSTTQRGIGKVPNACPAGQEKQGLLCYDLCQANYTGVGPVCWENCPAGFVDTGAFCNPRIYSGNNSGCPWYDKCGLTLDKVGISSLPS